MIVGKTGKPESPGDSFGRVPVRLKSDRDCVDWEGSVRGFWTVGAWNMGNCWTDGPSELLFSSLLSFSMRSRPPPGEAGLELPPLH